MTTASAAAPSAADVIEAGRVLAQLDDWRAMLFGALFIIVCLLFALAWQGISMARERARMWSLAGEFGTSADKVADALASLKTEIVVLRAVSSRVESRATYNGEGAP